MKYLGLFLLTIFITLPTLAVDTLGMPGQHMSLLWALPFVGILLSISIFPLVAEGFWHHHFGKISFFWALAVLVPGYFVFGYLVISHSFFHTIFLEYIPFIALLWALFTITGGVHIDARWRATPLMNVGILVAGTALASWMGTTGAAMLFIQPLLKTNVTRKHKTHIVVFFIFLVANVGGALTPLGDPPLFLGFLQGVDFFWTMGHLFYPMLFITIPLLVMFFAIDTYYYRKENKGETHGKIFLHVTGKVNFIFLLGVLLLVLLSGFWKSHIEVVIMGIPMFLENIVRDMGLVVMGLLSLRFSAAEDRAGNNFNWEPILEVIKLFFGIFITVAPVIAILHAGTDGALSFLVNEANCNGQPDSVFYFWLTGILSAFLDNAPTYYVFFHMASGDAQYLMHSCKETLAAISAGAVFMGALTYIGNAPNFMVRAIAVQNKVKMPSFFGYMVWSVCLLVPLFILLTVVFFV